MSEPDIVVIGSANMDLTVRVPGLPKPGETVSGTALERGAGGKGANQAVAARMLGARTTLIGLIGADEFGAELRRSLRAAGVDDSGLGEVAAATGCALVVVDEQGENMITLAPGANGTLRPADLERHAALIGSADVVLLQLEVPLATVLAAARLARSVGVPVVLNAAPLPRECGPELRELLSLTDLLIVNQSEAGGLLDLSSGVTPALPLDIVSALRSLGSSEVVVTLGADGAVYADATGEFAHVPAFPVDAIDAVGAGDVFCAALAVALAAPTTRLGSAVRRACAAAALATTRRGAQTAAPTGDRVEALLTAHPCGSSHAS
ncbi:ribokinase [Nocardia heshunensis]